MATIYIFHGLGSTPQDNWFPWLKKEVQLLGHIVIAPPFPHPSNPKLEEWLNAVESFSFQDAILVGHSLGVPFMLKLLETRKAKAAFLVAGFCSPLGLSLDQRVKTFLASFHWQKIQSNCPSFTILNSDNDPYIPLSKAQELAQNLNSPLTIINKAGHFNQTTLPLLLEKMKEQL